MDARSNQDLSAACVWATAMLAAMVVSDSMLVHAIFGLPMVFLVSGHTLIRAIGVKARSLLEHVVYAVGASLASGIAGGFVLNAIHCMTPLGWATWFWAVTIGASLVTAWRRETFDVQPSPRATGFRLWHGVTIALALLLATGAYALAIRDETSQRQFRYVELWMLPPANAGLGRLSIGVHSVEADTQRFDLEITLDGHPFAIFRSLTLAPGDTWTKEFPVPVSATAQKVEAKLVRPEDHLLYRSVSALVPPT
jgi:hypothetical protein